MRDLPALASQFPEQHLANAKAGLPDPPGNKSKAMRVVLEMFEPTLHWVALARVIENNPDLPNDVSLLVKKDRLAFVDSNGNEMAVLALENCFSDERVRDVNGKLAVLEWIHECFPGHHQLGVSKV